MIPKHIRSALETVLKSAMTGVYETSGNIEGDERTQAVQLVRGWLAMLDFDEA